MLLGVNVDHVATLREARKDVEPDPLKAAALALKGGADGITVHLREDRRHIQDRDLAQLRRNIRRPVELNLEMAATDEMIGIALKVRPDLVTLVPEKRAELTTEGGLNVKGSPRKIRKAIEMIQAKGIPVSLFINPAAEDVEAAGRLGALMVEIHTGLYSNAKASDRIRELGKVRRAVETAAGIGLKANAGHGLNYVNVGRIAALPGLRGLYIGHSIIAMSVYTGLESAVRRMKKLIREKGR